MRHRSTLGLLALGILSVNAIAADDASSNGDEVAVRAAGQSYVQAFNAHDPERVAEFWSPEAVYTNRVTGERVVGREAIASQFQTIFESDGNLKLQVDVESIKFVSPNVAVENGIATFLSSAAEPESVDYSAVYIRRGGKWLLDRVTDTPKRNVQSHYDHLKDLEWMIGNWVDEDDGGQIETNCTWTKNKNFITRSFSVTIEDRIELSGVQFIGWDAAAQQIRSWTFDSDGGFSEGAWKKDGSRWYVRKKGITADGSRAAAVNIITYVDESAFKLQSTQRTLGGALLPNIDEVIVVRR